MIIIIIIFITILIICIILNINILSRIDLSWISYFLTDADVHKEIELLNVWILHNTAH